jgi:hypothetical protein
MKPQRKAARARKSTARTTAPTVPAPKCSRLGTQVHNNALPLQGKAKDSRTQVINAARGPGVGLAVHVTLPDKVKALEAIRDAMPGNAATTQERRLLEALGRWSLSTFEASRYLDAYDPRARIMGLRNKGHSILTSWALVSTECGRKHRLGIYTLNRSGKPSSTGQHQPGLFPACPAVEPEVA